MANKEALEHMEERIRVAGRPELRLLTASIKQEIDDFRRTYGALKSNKEYSATVEELRAKFEVPLIRVCGLKELFSHLEESIKNFDRMPEHALIAVDLADGHVQPGKVEVYTLEATLFENMCALYNEARRMQTTLDLWKDPKSSVKAAGAMCLAAVLAAFNFVEGYFNGIACSCFLSKRETLSDKEVEVLTEWDARRSRRRYVSLNEKLLEYPRIAAHAKKPLLTEADCPELGFIADEAKGIRNAIAHPSPLPDPLTGFAEKEWFILKPDFSVAETIVDNAVRLVRRIEVAVYGTAERIQWLEDRGSDGFFPESVFS